MATIDGILSSVEWHGAVAVIFPVNIPGGGITPGTIFAMHNADNIYLAIRFTHTALSGTEVLQGGIINESKYGELDMCNMPAR
ncbi:MAG: hypothetical protein ACRESK_02735 [Gammaproteobacteria bacterium]